MKLRMLGNSLRFRLGRSEVETFGRSGSIEGKVRFGRSPENELCYGLETTVGSDFTGTFTHGKIIVRIPEKIVSQWVACDEVGISGSQKLDEQSDLKFLIEKDFVCLNAHNDEDQSDRYPHPKGPDAC